MESSAEDLFPYDGMIRVRFAGQGVTSPNLSRKHPTPRRRICFAVNSVYPKRNHLSSMEKHAIIASELRIFPEWRPIMSDSLQSLFSRCDSVLVFDTETSGLSWQRDEIIEFSAIR